MAMPGLLALQGAIRLSHTAQQGVSGSVVGRVRQLLADQRLTLSFYNPCKAAQTTWSLNLAKRSAKSLMRQWLLHNTLHGGQNRNSCKLYPSLHELTIPSWSEA